MMMDIGNNLFPDQTTGETIPDIPSPECDGKITNVALRDTALLNEPTL